MKKTVCFLVVALSLYACNNADRESGKSDSDIDGARNFIRSALDGDFDKASTFMVNDSLNQEDLFNIRRLSERWTPDEKTKYRESSIRVHETKKLDDSTSVIYYSNSFRNKRDSLKVVRINGQWLVDLKYIFKHKIDSLPQ